MKVVSLETLHLLHKEVISQEFFKWSFKQGFFLPRDSNNFALGFIFSDFEKESADISLLAICSLKSMLKYLKYGSFDIIDMLKRIKAMEVKNQS